MRNKRVVCCTSNSASKRGVVRETDCGIENEKMAAGIRETDEKCVDFAEMF